MLRKKFIFVFKKVKNKSRQIKKAKKKKTKKELLLKKKLYV